MTRGTTFRPSMFDRAVHGAFGWAFIRAVTSDRRNVQSVYVELLRRVERMESGSLRSGARVRRG